MFSEVCFMGSLSRYTFQQSSTGVWQDNLINRVVNRIAQQILCCD